MSARNMYHKLAAGQRTFAALWLLSLAPIITSCATAPVFPGAEWERIAEPEAVGFSTQGLEDLREHVEQLPSTGLVVVVDGHLLFENGNIADTSYIASVRKSVLAMLYGNYVADGTIDLNKTLAELEMSDIGGLSEQEQAATIADLLGARSGVYHEASNSGDNLADAPPRNSQKHGEYFLYSNWDFNALGFIFEQETGNNIYDALQTDLVDKLGFQDFNRATHRKSGDSRKSNYLAYHMNLSARDLARLGWCMLCEGQWDNQQVVPKGWTRKISSLITPVGEMNPEPMKSGVLGYGYLWWIFDGPKVSGFYDGTYTGIGAGGQFLTVVPKLNMVVAHKNNRRQNGSALSRDQYYSILDKVFAARIK